MEKVYSNPLTNIQNHMHINKSKIKQQKVNAKTFTGTW